MRIYKCCRFKKWADDEGVEDKELIKAIDEMNAGLIDAKLGDGFYKKRLAKKGLGKRGGYRVILAYIKDDVAFFLYGFSKNEKANIDRKEKKTFRRLSDTYLHLINSQLKQLIEISELYEVIYEKEQARK